MRTNHFRKIITAGILCALSLALVTLVNFPIIPAAPYLIYEPGDVPILIAGFILGPIYGIVMTIVVSIIQALTLNSKDGIFGFIMHLIATGTLVLTASLIFNKFKSTIGLIFALFAGTVAMSVVMAFANLVLSPIFYGIPREVVVSLLPTAIIPFNLLKAGINSIITMLVFQGIRNIPLIKNFNK
jgi:riboflavin transporter FmnP